MSEKLKPDKTLILKKYLKDKNTKSVSDSTKVLKKNNLDSDSTQILKKINLDPDSTQILKKITPAADVTGVITSDKNILLSNRNKNIIKTKKEKKEEYFNNAFSVTRDYENMRPGEITETFAPIDKKTKKKMEKNRELTQEEKELKIKKNRQFIVTIVLITIIILLLRFFVIEPAEIPSSSMEDTLKIGDVLLCEKITYKFENPKQRDIVIFGKDNTSYIKRVIATPGQTIDIKDGKVIVDGVYLDEPYTKGITKQLSPTIQFPLKLASDEFFVMGDNRENSKDSRVFGPIKKSVLQSKPLLVYWPLNRAKMIQ